MVITKEVYNKLKPNLKKPIDDKAVARINGISERTARQIRCTKDWEEYQAKNSAKRAKAREKVLKEHEDVAQHDEKICELQKECDGLKKENAEILQQRNWQFTHGYLFGLATGIIGTIVGVIIAMRIGK